LTKKPGVDRTPLFAPPSMCSVHALQVEVLLHLVVIAIQIELRLQCVLPQAVGLQVQLVLEKQVVHLPELALRARRLGGLGGELGVRMHFQERKMPVHETHSVAEALEQHFHRGIGLAARRALEIPYSTRVTFADAGPRT